MEHGISVYLRILLTLYTVSRIPSVCGKVNSWCGIIDYALVDRNYTTINANKNQKLCYQACLKDSPRCKSANYRPGDQECDLNCASHLDVCAGGRLVEQPGSIYTYKASKMGSIAQFDSTSAEICNIASVYPCCKDQGSDWQLVFRGVAGTGMELYDLWTNTDYSDSENLGNFRNETLYNAWNVGQLQIKQAKLSLYNQNEVKVEVIFNGTDSDILSWFAKERLVCSPWSDLTTTATTNYFSIKGNARSRRFFINRNYGGCSVDSGWLMVINAAGTCHYELSFSSYPVLLYSTHNLAVTWHEAMNDGTLGMADFLTIDISTE